MSSSKATGRMARLEEILGLRLLARTTRAFSPTERAQFCQRLNGQFLAPPRQLRCRASGSTYARVTTEKMGCHCRPLRLHLAPCVSPAVEPRRYASF
ncbi:LysR family transcriptional regulator [Caballeronia udeis]|uniref:helix-turn-helix domain-containing protein n=1 Tax=Caballeronia udeis TaxID=1232866 RepID=UPI00384AEF7A